MDGTIALGWKERKELLGLYRRHPDPAVGMRAHIVLLLGLAARGGSVISGHCELNTGFLGRLNDDRQ